jgi:hypothetical protein
MFAPTSTRAFDCTAQVVPRQIFFRLAHSLGTGGQIEYKGLFKDCFAAQVRPSLVFSSWLSRADSFSSLSFPLLMSLPPTHAVPRQIVICQTRVCDVGESMPLHGHAQSYAAPVSETLIVYTLCSVMLNRTFFL